MKYYARSEKDLTVVGWEKAEGEKQNGKQTHRAETLNKFNSFLIGFHALHSLARTQPPSGLHSEQKQFTSNNEKSKLGKQINLSETNANSCLYIVAGWAKKNPLRAFYTGEKLVLLLPVCQWPLLHTIFMQSKYF